jgi:hypothetical protein
MARLLLVLLAGAPFLLVGIGVGAWWTARSSGPGPQVSDRELEFRERMAMLQHHTDLLERSRRASLDGEPGLANIYAEAAERVLRLTDRSHDPGGG